MAAQISMSPDEVVVEKHNDFVRVIIKDSKQSLSFDHSFHNKTLFYQRIEPAKQTILKACSNKNRSIHTVLDLTAGWGIDSFILAQHGKQVTMLEQNPLITSILSASLDAAEKHSRTKQAVGRIDLETCNSHDYLRSLDSHRIFDCIYIDPMFPERKSGAKPAKEMQLLQKLTENLDVLSCFELALQKAANRVVVKRPAKAETLTQRIPDLTYREKTVRFDVYLCR